jgi:hypothetical protein
MLLGTAPAFEVVKGVVYLLTIRLPADEATDR